MENRKMVPEIRFSGFTDPWEQCKLGENCQVTMGQSPNGSTYSETPSKYILVQGNADLKDGWVFPRIWTTQKTRVANVGDIIMTVRAPAGAVGKTSYNVVLGRGVSGVKGNEFIYQSLVKMDIDGYWKKLAAGSTFESINCDDVNEANLMVPKDIDEQDRIGELLSILDHLIALHQRKLEKLNTFKKAMLDKMFPKNGKLIPEIRFSGFTDPWEQRKFNEIAETRRGLTYNPSDVCEDGIRVLRSSNINEDTFVTSDDDVFVKKDAINIPYACDGDILITSANGSSRLVGKHAIIRQIHNNSAVIGGFMLLATTKNSQFLNASMGSSWYTKFINLSAAGGNGAIGNLSKNELDEKTLFVPSDVEQETIGHFFKNIDNLITLHQRKLEKLQNIKKSMLNKMFI